jgi:hypothetical protein
MRTTVVRGVGIAAVLVAGLAGPVAGALAAADETPACPAWEVALPGDIEELAMSPDGRCVAALWGPGHEATVVTVFGADGSRLWDAELKAINPWLQAEHVAVAPGCRWVVLSGTAGYRYVWAVDRRGARWHLATKGTPEGVEVSHGGDLVVIGTANGRIYLVSALGEVLRQVEFGWGVTREIRFREDDRYFIANGGGLFERAGDLRLKRTIWWAPFNASQDFARFVVVDQAGHGPNVGQIHLVEANGGLVWYDSLCEVDGMIAFDGSFAMVRGGEILGPESPPACAPATIRIVGESGSLVGETEEGPCTTRFLAQDDHCIVLSRQDQVTGRVDLECRDRQFNLVWWLPAVRPAYVETWRAGVRWIAFADWRTIRAYRYPADVGPRR